MKKLIVFSAVLIVLASPFIGWLTFLLTKVPAFSCLVGGLFCGVAVFVGILTYLNGID